MSETFKSISKGLKEAIEYSKGNTKGAREFHPKQISAGTRISTIKPIGKRS